jgi:hypothetical protein
MQFDTLTSATYVARNLDNLLERAQRDTTQVVETGNIHEVVTYFSELRATVDGLKGQMASVQKHLDALSQELIPTLFNNQNTKTINVINVGKVTVNDRWSCSILKPDSAFDFVRKDGNGALIKPTIHPMTMGAYAKEKHEAGKPLPQDLFKVSSTPYTSITKA